MNTLDKPRTGWKQKIFHELMEYWIIFLYLAIFFGVFTNYRRLILAHYQISYEAYGFSIVKALVLAKVILVAEDLRLGQRFENRPLIVPTIYKAFLFTICVVLFSVIESVVGSFIHGKDLMGVLDDLVSQFNYERLAGALVIFFAFIPFFAVKELEQVLGEGMIPKLFFQRRSAFNQKTGEKDEAIS